MRIFSALLSLAFCLCLCATVYADEPPVAKPAGKCKCDLGPKLRSCDCGESCKCDPCECRSLEGVYRSHSEDSDGNMQQSAVIVRKTDLAGIYSVHGIDSDGNTVKGRGFRKGSAFAVVWISGDQQAGISVYEVRGNCLHGSWSFVAPDGPMQSDRLKKLGGALEDDGE